MEFSFFFFCGGLVSARNISVVSFDINLYFSQAKVEFCVRNNQPQAKSFMNDERHIFFGEHTYSLVERGLNC